MATKDESTLGSTALECASAARVLRSHAAEQERDGGSAGRILGDDLRRLAARLDALAERDERWSEDTAR